MIRENLTFILIFTSMMITIMVLHGCTAFDLEREAPELTCQAGCDDAGGCTAMANATGRVKSSERQVKLDTPTQTKVGLDTE